MLTCWWCGTTGTARDFELDPKGTGFWCPDCDGFTFYSQDEQVKHRLLLLLEQKSKKRDEIPDSKQPASVIPRFRKRLSPLRYPGGKSKFIDYLYTKLSAEKLDTFVEAFAGGASLGLALLDSGVINRLVLNDIDPDVYALWRTILKAPQALTDRLSGALPTHEDLTNAKRLLACQDISTPVRAWSFLLANRLSYSGICFANPQGGKTGSQEALLARWNPKALIDRIERIHAMADKIELHCKDCCDFIEESAWWMPNTTIFVDPPYYEKGAQLYRYSFTEDDHRRLAETLQSLYNCFPEADILITYDDHPFIRSLYPLAQQEHISRRYSI